MSIKVVALRFLRASLPALYLRFSIRVDVAIILIVVVTEQLLECEKVMQSSLAT